MEMPEGLEMQIRPRSGMSLKTPLLIQNTPGTVDSGYRGEICIICHCLYTNNLRPIEIKAGDRVAQGVMARVTHVAINEAEAISTSDRGENGFGSTGK
jgi:dUTP pyrophosphatase